MTQQIKHEDHRAQGAIERQRDREEGAQERIERAKAKREMRKRKRVEAIQRQFAAAIADGQDFV